MRIGWIGTGIMGNPMVSHVLKHSYEVHIYARHPQKVQNLVSKGAILESTIESLVAHVDVICTMVEFPRDVKEVYDKIFACIQKGQICIDFTTSSPKLAQELNIEAKKHHIEILDAPVTGGDVGAQAGTLTILVGGNQDVFYQMQPLFQNFGSQIEYCGQAGNGQYVKIANQIMIADTLQGICEAMVFLHQNHVPEDLIYKYLRNGAAGSRQLDLQGQKMLDKNYDPGFYVKHFVKDLKIAVNECTVSLHGVNQVIAEYINLMDNGYSDCGTQCLIEYFQGEKHDTSNNI